MAADLNADPAGMDNAELVAYQQELTRDRMAIKAKATEVQAELDARAAARAAQRAAEDAELGAIAKPPTQQLLGPSGAAS